MTLDEAVKILNERKHRMYDDWHVNENHPDEVDCSGYYDSLEEFEAVAIAEKYASATPLVGTVVADTVVITGSIRCGGDFSM